jgi:hypothetical protein
MSFKSYLPPVGLAGRGAIGITVAVLLSLWGAGAEAHKQTAPIMELTPELLKIRDDLANYEGPMAGHEPLIADSLHHYDLHAWLYKKNPSGVFFHANPDVDCTNGATYPLREEPPRKVPHN